MNLKSNQVGRDTNIELLRIIAILGVIILHYNNAQIGGGLAYVCDGSANYYILIVLEVLSICAVDLFMLISGYFLSNTKKRNLWKPIELITQVIIFKLGIYLLNVFLGKELITVTQLIYCFIPDNYFVILYMVVYLVSPYVNLALEQLSSKQLRTFVCLLVILFSVWPTMVDVIQVLAGREFQGLSTIGMYGSQRGYTAVNFLLLYVIGAFIRIEKKYMKKPSLKVITGLLMICIGLLTVWSLYNTSTAWEYCNPLVILLAILTFLLFVNIDLGANRIINHFAKATFSVFLLHSLFLHHISIQWHVTKSSWVMLLHIAVSAVGIYLVCWVGHCVYSSIVTPVFRKIADRIQLPSLDLSK